MLIPIPHGHVPRLWWNDNLFPGLDTFKEEELAAAFGNDGGSDAARDRAAAHVRDLPGRHWLLCNCRGIVTRPPVLFFRDEHVVRHPNYDEHSLSCAFHRTAPEQRAIVRSYRQRSANPLNLVKSFRKSGAEPRETSYATPSTIRNSLATVLAELLSEANIQTDRADELRPSLIEQQDEIERVARG